MSHEVAKILDKLTPYEGTKRLIKRRQDTFDIITDVLRVHNKMAPEYDRMCMDHWRGDPLSTARDLFNFMRRHVPYKEEKTLTQTTKSPAAILRERYTFGNDCKHYASYIIGVGAALNRRGLPVKCFYRFGSYPDPKGNISNNPGHVFAVFVINGREYWVDPVPHIAGFDSRTIKPVYKIDKMPPMKQQYSIGALYEINGIYDVPGEMNGPKQRMLQHSRPGMQHDRRPAPVQVQPHWLDDMPGTVGKGGKGKAKVKAAVKKVTQAPKKAVQAVKKGVQNTGKKIKKIQPGKLIKKVAIAPARNAYLALLKMNFANLATKIYLKRKSNPNLWPKLTDAWKKLGGDPNKLSTAISNGVSTHNKLHPKKKISGMADMYEESMSGGFNYDSVAGYNYDGVAGIEDPATIDSICGMYDGEAVGVAAAGAAALLAAAAPVIAALGNVLKAFGIKHDDVKDAAADADVNAAVDHNNATDEYGDGNKDIMPDGSVDHGNGVTTKVTTDPTTGVQTVSYDVADPDTKTKTKTTTSEYVDTNADGEPDTEIDTKTKKIVKHEGDDGGGSSFADMMANVKDFVSEHKWWFIGGGSAFLAILILPKLFNRAPAPKRRR